MAAQIISFYMLSVIISLALIAYSASYIKKQSNKELRRRASEKSTGEVISTSYTPRYFSSEEPVSEEVDEPHPFTEEKKQQLLNALPADDDDIIHISESEQERLESHLLQQQELERNASLSYDLI
jgi:hypothetical protein